MADYAPLIRTWKPSPNFGGRGGASVRLIVIHTAEGAANITDLGNFFADSSSQVSSHVGIDDQIGTIGQYVLRSDSAWTVANANSVSVSAETCAFAAWTQSQWMSHPNMLQNLAQWIYEESVQFNIPLVKLSPDQAQGSGRGVCFHSDLGSWGGGHTDPGNGFPIDLVMSAAATFGTSTPMVPPRTILATDTALNAQPSKSIPAIRKLELSTIDPAAVQRELMGEDVGIEKFMLYFSQKMAFDVASRITNATIDRSIEASSALTITINDYDRAVLTSGQLNNRLDVQIDGLWFRLAGVDKQGDDLVLTFEDREIAVLREYTKWKKVNRTNATRAQFVLNLIREVKEFYIPVVIPELATVMPIERFPGDLIGTDTYVSKQAGINVDAYNTKNGIGAGPTPAPNVYTVQPNPKSVVSVTKAGLTVKHAPATRDQIANAIAIIAVGKAMKAPRKVIVSAIMTAIQESTLINVPYGDDAHGGGKNDSVGLFQQYGPWGSYEDRMNPETSAKFYYNHAIPENEKYPNLAFWDLCYHVQACAYVDRTLYQNWFTEASAFVNAYGITQSDPSGKTEGLASAVNGMFDNVMNSIDGAMGIGAPTTSDQGGAYYFFRGNIVGRGTERVRKPENSWSCIQRLAGDVNYAAFFVSGTFYWISEDLLLKQKPEYILNEFMDGIQSMDGSYKHMSKAAELTINADVGRWMAPPGTCILIQDMGVWNGRWIVTEYSRSLFDLQATITLKKPRPVLPEPITGNQTELTQWLPQTGLPGSIGGTDVGTGPSGKPVKDVGVPSGDLINVAKQLYAMNGFGKYHADNPGDLSDIINTMNGQKVASKCGGMVTMDIRVFQLVLWLIGQGYKIGTFAFCSDHHCDSMTGHSGGFAVDISSINGVAVREDSTQCRNLVLQIDELLHNTPKELTPRQLISGGYGQHRDDTCRGYCIPAGSAGSYYDEGTMADHLNHIHVGY